MTEVSLDQFDARLGELSNRVDEQSRAIAEIGPELARMNERLEHIANDTRSNGDALQSVRDELHATRTNLSVELEKVRTGLQVNVNKILLAIVGATVAIALTTALT